MSESEQVVDQKIIEDIIVKRLSRVPLEIKRKFPDVLKRDNVFWATISEPEYFMIVFLTLEDEQRINDFIKKRLNPFLGLITTKNESAAFRVEKSRNMMLSRSNVSNSFSFSLGQDSTIILEDHGQTISTKDLGVIAYRIPLAYIISYGNEINRATMYEYFEGLVVYSTNMWTEAHDRT